jgi:hypothetical protein
MCHLTASPRGWTSKGETGSVRDGTVSGHTFEFSLDHLECHDKKGLVLVGLYYKKVEESKTFFEKL